jgi:disulfide bond formation protein DsbB
MILQNLSTRQLNLIGFAACAALMAYALFAQYVLDLEPCPLCIFQRVAVIALGAVFLVATLYNPGRISRIIYTLLLLLAGGAGIGVAARHVWLQNLPPDKVPSCGPGLDFMLNTFPLLEVLSTVLSGSGECAEIDWSFLGLSMPAWVLIAVSVLTAFGIWANLRRAD